LAPETLSRPQQRLPRLYIVTDRQQTADRPLEEIIAAATQCGASMVQLREKDLSARELYMLGSRLKPLLDAVGVPLLINDRIDVALALDAAGVHLAGHSLPTPEARRVLGAPKLLGVSTHSLDQARAAADEGADFVVFGPVFSTPSKLAYGPPQGVSRLAEVVRHVAIPVLAIGGITTSNVSDVLAAGAYGIAMIRAVLAASDPQRVVAQLLTHLPA
jgi:thiamine-phosphate pyrophosphorylase